MKNSIFLFCFSLSILAFSQQKETKLPVNQMIKNIAVFTSAENSDLRLSKTNDLIFENAKQPLETEICIFVNPKKTFQTFLGIGGAVTDASAEVFSKLSDNNKKQFLDAYYSLDNGIGYSLLRTTIHSCDFSSESYTYVEENDKDLKSFSINRDLKFRIPLIQSAIKTAFGKIKVYVSPWSPPAFMKTNNNMLRGGSLLPKFNQSWANYYSKFIKAYQKEGIPIWGLTIQNEPMANQIWESCIFTAETERDFLKNYLGPTLKKDGLGDKKIIVWDHNRDLIAQRADVIFSDPEASKYAWGIGFHWYETWTGGKPMFDNIKNVNTAYPTKNLIFTEGCIEKFDASKYQSWSNAERYGNSMINDFNNGTVAWTDWNILLDQNGGPNHVKNFCFAPIHADVETNKLIFTPSYYYIGHFSKFIRPNAKRIATSVSRSILSSTSFQNLDGKIVTIVLNQSDAKIEYNLYLNSTKTTINIAPHAIQTLIY